MVYTFFMYKVEDVPMHVVRALKELRASIVWGVLTSK